LELKDYFRIIVRNIWIILILVAVAVGGAYYYTDRQPRIYQSQATLLFSTPSGGSTADLFSEIYVGQSQLKTMVQMIKGEPILTSVSSRMNVPVGSLRAGISAAQMGDTQLVSVTYTSTDPAQAQRVLNAVADDFSQYIINLYMGFTPEKLVALDEQITSIKLELEKSQQELDDLIARASPTPVPVPEGEETATVTIAVPPKAGELEAARAKLAFYQNSYLSLLARRESAKRAQIEGISQVTVYERASLSTTPISPRTSLNLAMAAVLGLFLGIGVAFLRDYLDDTVKTEEDVEKMMKGLPVLGAVPVIPKNGEGKNGSGSARTARGLPETSYPRLAVADNPKSAVAEGFRTLRTNLQFLSADRPLRTLVISSSAPSEGKSTVAVNLAISMAQMDQRVILVDCDLRRPTLHRTFGLNSSPGLCNFLAGKAKLEEILRESSIPGLRLITAGPVPPMPAELLGSHRMKELLATLAEQADTVIIDTPPSIAVTDATLLSVISDGVILVVSCGKTTRDQAKTALLTLEKAGVTPLGVVMNMVDRRRGYGYYYYYYRKYYSHYEAERKKDEQAADKTA